MPNKNGLELIKPTSIASTGTGNSSSISANGSVTFSSCESLSFNGVFSSLYDNYMIVMRAKGSTLLDVYWRMRANGTDNSTASSYTIQYMYGNGTSVSGGRETNSLPRIAAVDDDQRDGLIIYIYGPNIAQPTALRTITVEGYASGSIFDVAGTHNVSASYDGLTLSMFPGYSYSGLAAVYGLRN